jgi:tRNA (adenine22-N1)-methyltransferase
MTDSVNLGPRLSLVASYVPKDSLLGDIGTDHAYLPIYLWENRVIKHAVAVDVHEGPYQSARSAIQSRGLESVIDVRYGDGLKPVHPGEVNTLTLAGMGGNTMLEIIHARPEVVAQVNTLVLQPQGAEGKVRLRLLQAGWKLNREQLVEEEDRIYVVMSYSRKKGFTFDELQDKVEQWFDRVSIMNLPGGETVPIEEALKKEILTKLVWDMGPLILEQPVPELKELIEDNIQSMIRATHEMKKSSKLEVQGRIQKINFTCALLEELKRCLFPLV